MDRIISVIGMGRSGTSLICQMINSLDNYYFGKEEDLHPASIINERGHFEYRIVHQLNREILKNIFNIHSWLFIGKLEEGWQNHKYVRTFKKLLTYTIEHELREASKLNKTLVIKDPRITMFLPMWIDIFKDAGADPVWIYSQRDYKKIYKSLIRTTEVQNQPVPEERVDPEHIKEMQEQFYNEFTKNVKDHNNFPVIDYGKWLNKNKAEWQAVLLLNALHEPTTKQNINKILNIVESDLVHF